MIFAVAQTGAIAEVARIDSSGNLGLGVTPSAWGSNARVMQFVGTGAIFAQTNANIVSLTQNLYWDNTNFKYIATDAYGALKYTQYQGQHLWQNAPAGVAAATATMVTLMTLDSSGKLGIGMTPVNVLDITQTQNAGSAGKILNSSSGASAYSQWLLNNGTTYAGIAHFGTNFTASGVYRTNGTYIYSTGAGGITINTEVAQPIYFGINSVEKARIDTSGNFLPGANNSLNLGSATMRWATVYTGDLDLNNGVGNWTIVEGEENLFIYNNKSDKVYKFNLTEVDPATATPKKE
jgi:hypothetical protein